MKKLVPDSAILIPAAAKCVFRGQIFDVYQWPQEMFDGSKATFEMLKRPDTVTVIPVVGDEIITIEDSQPHTGTKLSFPGGRVDKEDSDTLAAARREVKEETGYEFSNWKLVNVTQPHAKLEWFIYFYIAWDGRQTGQPHLDAGERIAARQLPFDEVKKLVVAKSGYLGESQELFSAAGSLADLVESDEFKGQIIDR